jgi:hypothetical protein
MSANATTNPKPIGSQRLLTPVPSLQLPNLLAVCHQISKAGFPM